MKCGEHSIVMKTDNQGKRYCPVCLPDHEKVVELENRIKIIETWILKEYGVDLSLEKYK